MGNRILEYAEERGIKIGEKRGEERGIRLKAEDVAKKMVKNIVASLYMLASRTTVRG